MLSLTEQILFLLLLATSIFMAYRSFSVMFAAIGRGQGKLHTENLSKRLINAFSVFTTQKTVLVARPVISFVHALVAWAFILYFLVNLGDILTAYIPDYRFLGDGMTGNLYRLFVDIFSVLAVAGVAVFLLRRFVFSSPLLKIRDNVKLMPEARAGIARDSLLVGLFIMGHVGFRFIGESFHVAQHPDEWQPFATLVAGLWNGMDSATLTIGYHAGWWLALGLILLFVPYFPKSKHAHLFMGPLNYLTRPERSAPGTMERLDFEAEDAEQFGVAKMEHLDQTQIFDAYACIMCNRCQDVCPAYQTGKELSPSALEVNKRYYLNMHGADFAAGKESELGLLDFALTESALWACTSCAACVEICPVGNEPMYDILNMRRDKVLMEASFPSQLQTAFNGMERNGNPWNMNKDRLEWAKEDESLDVKTVEQNPEFEVLYWVGCAGAFDQKGQNIARSFAKILNKANVNFAVLGNSESCTGDSARRAGNEYLFNMMAENNVETLNGAGVKKIVTTCPHCMHTLKNEYPQFGGKYEVVHHTQFIDDLVSTKKLKLKNGDKTKVSFHDPCYLGRHNQVYDEPRSVLSGTGMDVVEMDRNKNRSFCCGAGGGNMWKEEEHGELAVRQARYKEAQQTGCDVVGTGCPFCMTMLKDAGNELSGDLKVQDIAEIVAERIEG
jgi:Fe-S oxidoreductase